jgi:uncharacterized protein YbjT (DUF2867 family)
MQRTALIAGASGLVGRELLARLLDDPRYAAVHALVRRPLDTAHPRLVQRQVDFAQLAGQVPAVDDAYCALGTTLRAAGSRRAFERVDVDHVIALAHAARAAGARRFIVVSAVGSHPRALSFYARAKARMEAGVSALDFDAVHILQPSLLLGESAARTAAHLPAGCGGPSGRADDRLRLRRRPRRAAAPAGPRLNFARRLASMSCPPQEFTHKPGSPAACCC